MLHLSCFPRLIACQQCAVFLTGLTKVLMRHAATKISLIMTAHVKRTGQLLRIQRCVRQSGSIRRKKKGYQKYESASSQKDKETRGMSVLCPPWVESRPLVKILNKRQRARLRTSDDEWVTCSSFQGLLILVEMVIYQWLCGGQVTAAGS